MRKILFLTITSLFVLTTSCRKASAPTQKKQETAEKQAKDSTAQSEDSTKIDFVMSDMSGKNQSVAAEAARHKLTVIDFWASWCGPCREEMPRLVHLYNMYKDKGLGVIGVSLDEDRAQWEAAVDKMNMTWMQLSDLQGWNNAAAVMYGIQSIPFTIIVDSKSNVVDTGLRGEQLANLIEEKLGK